MPVHIEDEYDKIYRYCFYKVHNSVLAEDLTQETFLKYFSQDSYIERGKRLAYQFIRNIRFIQFNLPRH